MGFPGFALAETPPMKTVDPNARKRISSVRLAVGVDLLPQLAHLSWV
jgi:hypothetical protein